MITLLSREFSTMQFDKPPPARIDWEKDFEMINNQFIIPSSSSSEGQQIVSQENFFEEFLESSRVSSPNSSIISESASFADSSCTDQSTSSRASDKNRKQTAKERKEKNTLRRREKRRLQAIKEKEKANQNEAREQKKNDRNYREYNQKAVAKTRSKPEYRNDEREKDRLVKQVRRSVPENRTSEQITNSQMRRDKRNYNPDFRADERKKDRERKRGEKAFLSSYYKGTYYKTFHNNNLRIILGVNRRSSKK